MFEICARKRVSLSEETCFEAALNGHLECLKYAHENGCPWDLINEDNDDDTVELACSNAALKVTSSV